MPLSWCSVSSYQRHEPTLPVDTNAHDCCFHVEIARFRWVTRWPKIASIGNKCLYFAILALSVRFIFALVGKSPLNIIENAKILMFSHYFGSCEAVRQGESGPRLRADFRRVSDVSDSRLWCDQEQLFPGISLPTGPPLDLGFCGYCAHVYGRAILGQQTLWIRFAAR